MLEDADLLAEDDAPAPSESAKDANPWLMAAEDSGARSKSRKEKEKEEKEKEEEVKEEESPKTETIRKRAKRADCE